MKLLTNKYFILGNLFLILLAIPVTLFFVKKQQETRSKAAPSTTLSFSPDTKSTTTACPNFKTDVMVDPGQNVVAIVDMHITYDATKLQLLQIDPSSTFSTIVRDANIAAGTADISVSTGGDISKAVQGAVTKVATFTFKPLTATAATAPTIIAFDTTKTKALSLDGPENIMATARPANITITENTVCPDTASPTPTTTASPSPTATVTVAPTATVVPTATVTPTPTVGANTSPICTDFSPSPTATGTAPLAVLFTARGNDPDGLVAKTTFNFGDGHVQDVTDGMNSQSVAVQINHIYVSGGSFNATVTFTDNRGGISQSCSNMITASGSGTVTPTTAPTAAPTTPAPTVPPTGSVGTTIGIIGGVILTILGGIFLLAL